jgi:hypothetical protein
MDEVIEWDITPAVVPDMSNQASRLDLSIDVLRKKLKAHATLCGDKCSRDTGEYLPAEHCAIEGCGYNANERGGLEDHLQTVHGDVFATARKKLDRCDLRVCPDNLHMYYEAIKRQEQMKIPTVGCTVDRRAHAAFCQMGNDAEVEALICFCCARVLVKASSDGCVGEMKLIQPLKDGR